MPWWIWTVIIVYTVVLFTTVALCRAAGHAERTAEKWD